MGWSCRKEAEDAMRRLTGVCVRATGSLNVFHVGDAEFFREHDHEEYDDGRIMGEVFRILPGGHARRVGEFTIRPDGTLTGATRGCATRSRRERPQRM
jgi:hypothetical protein